MQSAALLESLMCKLCETDRKRMHGFRVYARIVKVRRKHYIEQCRNSLMFIK